MSVADLSSVDVSGSGDDEVTGGDAAPTVRERPRVAHVSDERVREHFGARAIQLDGAVVSDLGIKCGGADGRRPGDVVPLRGHPTGVTATSAIDPVRAVLIRGG